MINLKNRDFLKVISFLGPIDKLMIWLETQKYMPEQSIAFYVTWEDGYFPKMSKKQAALAVVICIDASKSSNKRTKERSRSEWCEEVDKFLEYHPGFKAKNWTSYLLIS